MPRMGWQLCRGISGSFRLESVAGLLWNQWQLSCGTGGSFAVESVAGFTWNRWQLWRGIRKLGTTIQTAFMERWYGTLRGLVAPLRRRTRCLSWSRIRHRGRLWLMVSLYNFVMPHKSLRQGHTRRTPAMAIGLTNHVWSYREYI